MSETDKDEYVTLFTIGWFPFSVCMGLLACAAYFLLAGCAHTHPPAACEHDIPDGHVVLTAPLIPKDALSFPAGDGCNTCTRQSPGSHIVTCTLLYCGPFDDSGVTHLPSYPGQPLPRPHPDWIQFGANLDAAIKEAVIETDEKTKGERPCGGTDPNWMTTESCVYGPFHYE